MIKKRLDFYFDFLSPYAYFSWVSLKTLASDYDLDIHYYPVPYPLITNHWGLKGTATIPSKREFVYKDTLRYSRLMKIPFKPPATHPFKPYLSLRLCIEKVAGILQYDMIEAIWQATWVCAVDMSSEKALLTFLDNKKLPAEAFSALAKTEEIKTHYKEEVSRAIRKGVFGVPTIIIDDELFWGRDQFIYIKHYLDGHDILKDLNSDTLTPPKATWGL